MADWRAAIERRLEGLRVHPTRAAELIEELSQHLDDRYAELRAGGADDDSARRDALAELDGQDLVAALAAVETARSSELPPIGGTRRGNFVSNVWHDVRYAARMLRKNPGFTLVAVLTLALGIGATTAIFSVINGVMLRPLPFANADRLVRVWESDIPRGRPEFSVSQPNFLDFRARSQTFERMAATAGLTMNLTSGDSVEPLVARAVTIDFLPALGARPALGRNFVPDEDRPGGNTRVALVTHGFWQRRLAADARVVGTTIALNGASYSVVGVLPESFVWAVPNLDLLVPLAADPAQPRADHRLLVFGLLKPGVQLPQANADLQAIAAQLSAQYPDSNGGWSVLLRSFYDWLVPGETRRMLLVFLAAVGIVLLIASSNVANLMLARAAARQKEMSIRVALGAGRGRVLAQLLVESILLAMIAGTVGCAIAVGATQVLKAMGPDSVPRLDEVAVDGRVLLFAFVVSVATGVLFGLAPAIQASRPNMNESLKDAGRTGAGGTSRQRLRDSLVILEVALSVALLVGAGLLIRSMWTLQSVDPGFDPRKLLTMQVSLSGPMDQTGAKARAFYRQLLEKIGSLPGVTSAATSSIVPMGGGNTSIEVVIEGRAADSAGIVPSADWRVVSAGYFRTLGVALRGRDFDERDDKFQTVIVGEEMARRYWAGVDPIGRSFFWHSATGPRLTVVGVAGDVRNLSLETEPAPVVYLPSTAFRWNPMFLTIRTATDPASQTGAVRNAVRAIDPKVPISNVRTGEEILAVSIGPRRFTMFLLASFAGLALILASVGLFGVLSYLVSQRTHDIGVRLALGATPRDVFRLVVGRGMLLAGSGAAAGLAAAFWLSRALQALLFQVRPTDLITFATVVVVLLGVALIACYVPARRATRVDPVVALRYE
jgi:predicted permease